MKDLNGHELQAIIRDQPSQISCSNGTLSGVSAFIFNTFVEGQNARLKIKRCTNPLDTKRNFRKIFCRGNYDLILSSNIPMCKRISEPICSYQPLDFCVAIPRKFIRKSLQRSFIHPLKKEVIGLVLVSVFLGSLIWGFIYYKKLSRSSNSPARFFFGIFGYFVGQDVGFQRLCLHQKSLLQLFMFGAFFLSNLFNSELISLREKYVEIKEISRFEDIKNHEDLFIYSRTVSYQYLKALEYDQDLMKHLIEITAEDFIDIDYEDWKSLGIFLRCSALNKLIDSKNESFDHYILDEKFNFNFEYFFYDRLNPYRIKLQNFLNAFFEGSLERYYYLFNEKQRDLPTIETSKKISLYSFEDMRLVFMIYLAGHVLGIFIFFGEHLWGKLAKKKLNVVVNLHV